MLRRWGIPAGCAIAVTVWALLAGGTAPAQKPAESGPVFGSNFWSHWGDGRAELSAYDLEIPRYGQKRRGVAVAVFVTETFSDEARVKADPGRHAKSDEFPVLKLNLAQDFQTGVYDYHLMTSCFVALTPHRQRPAGSPTKISFSAQEWCGHAYQQLLFDETSIRSQQHSYFDGEADAAGNISYPENGMSEDALWFWVRGFAGPTLAAGQSREVPMLRSLQDARLRHRSLDWRNATLSRGASPKTISVPAGSFEVEEFQAKIQGGRTWTFEVETQAPRRVVRWRVSDGQQGTLLGTSREAYWQQHGEGQESILAKLGLKRRPQRSP